MTKELVWILFYFKINKWKNLKYTIFMNQLGESTLHPPEIVVTNTQKNCIGFFGMCGHHKHEALWLFKKCMLYILSTFILFNPLYLTIGWGLTFIQNQLWAPKCCHAHFKVFILIFKIFKRCHQDFNLLHTYYTCYTSLFWAICGEKWFTCNVFSLDYWLWNHLVFFCFKEVTYVTNCMEHQVMMSYKDMTMKCFGYVIKNIKINRDENNIDVSKGKKMWTLPKIMMFRYGTSSIWLQ